MMAEQRTIKIRSEIGGSLLGVAFLRMEQEGLLPMMFWEKAPTLRTFLEWCEQPNSIVAGCFVERPGPTLDAPPDIRLAGLGWLHNIKTRNGCRYADVGEVFWREYQAMGMTHDMGKSLLDFAFNECQMTAIYGITPEKNIAAVRFMKNSGFTAFGPIPWLCCWQGVECGGYLSVLTKETWEAK
jgi:RimJ/RimL family protein N-acetyltransferase